MFQYSYLTWSSKQLDFSFHFVMWTAVKKQDVPVVTKLVSVRARRTQVLSILVKTLLPARCDSQQSKLFHSILSGLDFRAFCEHASSFLYAYLPPRPLRKTQTSYTGFLTQLQPNDSRVSQHWGSLLKHVTQILFPHGCTQWNEAWDHILSLRFRSARIFWGCTMWPILGSMF